MGVTARLKTKGEVPKSESVDLSYKGYKKEKRRRRMRMQSDS